MELKDFVAETLVEIQQGVQEAIKRTTELKTNGVINPVWGSSRDVNADHIREVTFDIAVTVSDKSGGKVGGGIKVVGLSLGSDVSQSEERSHISRIQFAVRMVHPVTEVQSEH